MTLREIIEQHPEWLDRHLTIVRHDGLLEYVGRSASIRADVDDMYSVLIITPN